MDRRLGPKLSSAHRQREIVVVCPIGKQARAGASNVLPELSNADPVLLRACGSGSTGQPRSGWGSCERCGVCGWGFTAWRVLSSGRSASRGRRRGVGRLR